MSEEKFIIDSSALMTSFDYFYAPDIAPSFWDRLAEAFSSGRIVMLDVVLNEINVSFDDLPKWLKKHGGYELCKHKDEALTRPFGEVIEFLRTSGYYRKDVDKSWNKESIADAWLIAAAKAYGYVIITFEKADGLTEGVQHKSAKIPDVANHFGVKTENLFYMMRALGISI